MLTADPIQRDPIQRDPIQHDPIQHDLIQHDPIQTVACGGLRVAPVLLQRDVTPSRWWHAGAVGAMLIGAVARNIDDRNGGFDLSMRQIKR